MEEGPGCVGECAEVLFLLSEFQGLDPPPDATQHLVAAALALAPQPAS